ncbi:hypothetical protein SteCoe_23965 [Stentor coeruleus]|uniref:ODAD1 central coiled coil region domain-containing protein n=1 Tax=Stentor coeruleus TaxID=5963 RepID=A0A1R2BIM2_9CILI|nr:hypothetical protein SteCoe_23965 [Stentor coeruleus]
MNKINTDSKCSSYLKDSQSARLQRNLETLTVNLEHEKRESMYLDEQIELLQYEMESLPKTSTSSFASIRSTISVMKKKLELETNTLNQTKHKNRQLRQQINEYRLDKSAHKQSLNAIIDNFDRTSKATNDQYEEITTKKHEDHEHQEKIGILRTKSANQRIKYNEKISTLSSILKSNKYDTRSYYEDTQYSAQCIEVISVLKQLVKTSHHSTIDKKRQIDHYIKYIALLINYFNDIRAVTGINDVNDVVTSCLKSEEQSQHILVYLNDLNSEIDVLEERLKFSNERIAYLEGSKYQGRLSIQEAIKTNETNFNQLKSKIADKEKAQYKVYAIIQSALPMLKRLYKLLEFMNFKAFFSSHLDVDAIDKLNQEYSGVLLGKIEEFINYLMLAIELQKQSTLSVHNYPSTRRKVEYKKKKALKHFLDERDLYDEPEFDDTRVPINFEDMKQKAVFIFDRRKSMLKAKPGSSEIVRPKTPNYRLAREIL